MKAIYRDEFDHSRFKRHIFFCHFTERILIELTVVIFLPQVVGLTDALGLCCHQLRLTACNYIISQFYRSEAGQL